MQAEAKRFALLGAAGYIAPRHLEAIRAVGGDLVAAHDPHDSVGVLDAYFPKTAFFTEIERFDRHLEKLNRQGRGIDYLVVCSPNYLHDAHCRLGLRLGANIICEKPVTLNPWNLDALEEIEAETNKHIYCILQSRLHPSYELLQSLARNANSPLNIRIKYITPRGPWYRYSWKGDTARSGGVITNIGIHLLDALLSCYGPATGFSVRKNTIERASGQLSLKLAEVAWELSVRPEDLPPDHQGALRQFTVNGQSINFSTGFEALHVESYRQILAGKGFRMADARPAVTLVSEMRNSTHS